MAALVPSVKEYRGTTVQVCGLWPFSSGASTWLKTWADDGKNGYGPFPASVGRAGLLGLCAVPWNFWGNGGEGSAPAGYRRDVSVA
jgi:hypothetical protein